MISQSYGVSGEPGEVHNEKICLLEFINSELVEDKNYTGGHNYGTHQDGKGYHIALVLPIGHPAGRTTAAKECMGIDLFTVATRS